VADLAPNKNPAGVADNDLSSNVEGMVYGLETFSGFCVRRRNVALQVAHEFYDLRFVVRPHHVELFEVLDCLPNGFSQTRYQSRIVAHVFKVP